MIDNRLVIWHWCTLLGLAMERADPRLHPQLHKGDIVPREPAWLAGIVEFSGVSVEENYWLLVTGQASDDVLARVLSFVSSHTSIGRSRMATLAWSSHGRPRKGDLP